MLDELSRRTQQTLPQEYITMTWLARLLLKSGQIKIPDLSSIFYCLQRPLGILCSVFIDVCVAFFKEQFFQFFSGFYFANPYPFAAAR